MKKSQVMTGIPTYAHSYTLVDEKSHGIYSLAKGVGRMGDFPGYDTVSMQGSVGVGLEVNKNTDLLLAFNAFCVHGKVSFYSS